MEILKKRMTDRCETLVYALFDCCEKILDKAQSKILNTGIKNVRMSLNRYKAVFKKTEPMDHKPFFMAVYNQNKEEILGGRSDNWLRKGNVSVQIVDGNSEINKHTRILLSSIYERAIELRKLAMGAYENDPVKILISLPVKYPEVKSADMLNMTLHKIFCYYRGTESNAEEEVKTLKKHIESFENALGLRMPPPGSSPPYQTPSGPLSFGPAGMPDLSAFAGINPMTLLSNPEAAGGIIRQGLSVLENSGLMKPEPGAAENLSKVFSTLMQNPRIKSITEDLQNISQNNGQAKQEDVNKIIGNAMGLFSSGGGLNEIVQDVRNQVQAGVPPAPPFYSAADLPGLPEPLALPGPDLASGQSIKFD